MDTERNRDTYYRLARESGVLPTRWAYSDLDEEYDGEDGFQVWGLTGKWGVLAAICGLQIDGDFPIEEYPFLISIEAENVTDGASIWYSVSEFSNSRQCSTQALREWLLSESGCPNPNTDLDTDWNAFAEWTEDNSEKIVEWLVPNSQSIEPTRKDTLL